MHHLVGDTFRAMVSLKFSKNGFCPYTMMQKKRFLPASGIKDAKNLKISTISFIVTSVSKIVFQCVSFTDTSRLTLSGLKFLGKSINLVFAAILNNYQGHRVVLLPHTSLEV